MRRSHISPSEFERLVDEALASLPLQFRQLLENVAVIVEEEPSIEDYEEHGLPEDQELLGLFRGIPRSAVSHNMPPSLPNQISIFRGPILRISSSREQAMNEIRDTVVHELGHYFGLDDAGMPY